MTGGDKPPVGTGVVFLCFGLVFSLLCVTSLLQKSPTVDEPVHLLGGYSYLKWADFRVNPEHPPAVKMWAALPLLSLQIKDPRPSRPLWDLIPKTSNHRFANYLALDMFYLDNDAETLFLLAKLQMIAVGVLLGWFVYQWSKKLFGIGGAIVSLFVYCLDPNIIAHSQIVHTDIPFAAFYFISTYFFWRSLNQFNWVNVVCASLFFGLAAITKYSFIAILPSWIILGLVRLFNSEPQPCSIFAPRLVANRWPRAGLLAALLACSGITAYLAVWASYGFRFSAIPGQVQVLPFAQVMPDSSILKSAVSVLREMQLFPEAWLYGQLYVLRDLTRRTYFMGELSGDGFWSYFPVLFLVKTPVPTLLLLIAVAWLWVRNRREWILTCPLVIPPLIYFGMAVASLLNIGIRHILPVYPFLFVLIGGTVVKIWLRGSRLERAGLLFVGAWYLWSSLGIFPHYLSFFNELAGGPKNGHKVVVDSNLDWGQDVKGVKRWMDRHGVDKIQWVYFGYADPEYYGIDAVDLPGNSLAYIPPPKNLLGSPQYAAVSATYLGLFQDQPFIKALRAKEPIATIGYSIHVYKFD